MRLLDLFCINRFLASIPRPERSGCVSVLVFFSLVSSLWMTGTGSSVECGMWPWACLNQMSEQQPKTKERRITWVTFGPGGSDNAPCTCHLDLRYFGKPIQHIHFRSEETCDSEHYLSQTWIEPPSVPPPSYEFDGSKMTYIGILVTTEAGTHYEMNHGEGEFRLHCENGKTAPLGRDAAIPTPALNGLPEVTH